MNTKANTVTATRQPSRNHTVSITNDETGEILAEQSVQLLVSKSRFAAIRKEQKELNGFVGDHIIAFQSTLLKAATELPSGACRVLCYLMARLDFENYIHISNTEIAAALNISSQQTIYTHIHTLIDGIEVDGEMVGGGYLCKVEKGGTMYIRLNPQCAWKGKLKPLLKVLRGRNWQAQEVQS
ncbi:MAG: hypothetical protein ACLQF0_01355 [Dissulfurispiraceae bacterium]